MNVLIISAAQAKQGQPHSSTPPARPLHQRQDPPLPTAASSCNAPAPDATNKSLPTACLEPIPSHTDHATCPCRHARHQPKQGRGCGRHRYTPFRGRLCTKPASTRCARYSAQRRLPSAPPPRKAPSPPARGSPTPALCRRQRSRPSAPRALRGAKSRVQYRPPQA